MRNPRLAVLVTCLCGSAALAADDATPQEAGRDLGAVLAWRLGPEAVAERCRTVDPEGATVRDAALKNWLEKNAKLINAVDNKVAEVVPLIQRGSANGDPVAAVRGQVREILLETVFGGKSPAEIAEICKAEANPEVPRWTNNGLPRVPQSLAALADWQVRRGQN